MFFVCLTYPFLTCPSFTASNYDYEADPLEGFVGQPCPGSSGATPEQMQMADSVGLFVGLVAQTGVGALGILGNLLAMIVLVSTKRLKSVFNQVRKIRKVVIEWLDRSV